MIALWCRRRMPLAFRRAKVRVESATKMRDENFPPRKLPAKEFRIFTRACLLLIYSRFSASARNSFSSQSSEKNIPDIFRTRCSMFWNVSIKRKNENFAFMGQFWSGPNSGREIIEIIMDANIFFVVKRKWFAQRHRTKRQSSHQRNIKALISL